MVPLLLPLAFAGGWFDDFSTDHGLWSGGQVVDGVLRVDDAATLELGERTRLSGSPRVRLASGSRVVLLAGEARWTADHGADGGLSLGEGVLPMPTGRHAWVADLEPVIEPAEPWDAGSGLHPEVG